MLRHALEVGFGVVVADAEGATGEAALGCDGFAVLGKRRGLGLRAAGACTGGGGCGEK